MPFKHDVFISYAWRDKRWVQAFRGVLEEVLRTRLDAVHVWIDTAEAGPARAFDGEIADAIANTALLVVVMSEPYLKSDWCRKERECFVEQCGGPENANGRIFLLRIDAIEPERYPVGLRFFTGFDFFEANEETGVVAPVDLTPKPGVFHDQLYRLRHHVIPALQPLMETPATAVTRHKSSANGSAGTVFLADVFPVPEYNEQRAEIEMELAGQGIRVVPQRAYWDAPDGYEAEVDAQLRACDLFVQLLTESDWPPSERFSEGYSQWLLERALLVKEAPTAGRPSLRLLRWRPRDFTTTDPNDTFFTESVKPCALQEFKGMLLAELANQRTRQAHGCDANADQVVICYDEPDRNAANHVGDQIEEIGAANDITLDAAILDHRADLRQEVKALRPRGMVVVLDQAQPESVLDRMRLCRREALARKMDRPHCAVVVPSVKDFFLPHTPPGFSIIARDHRDSLRDLVTTMVGKGGATA